MFDPVKLAEETRRLVCDDGARKYYRFRSARFYGGISTADCVGCNLRCVFCWAYNVVKNPGKFGRFYSAKEVARKLVEIAERKGIRKLRISGNEPTICKDHLIDVLENLPRNYLFILETNGILIGEDEDYARELARFENLHVRVSLKGTTPVEFSRLTGARPDAFGLQLKALRNLARHGVSHHAAVITIANQDREGLLKKLEKVSPGVALEEEPLILYPSVKRRLEKAGIKV